ncbi:hypothetical protein NGR_b13400 (plasmid) [Sinorhizobium fredii NGR234]|uniref:Uncharacterized protein n=1 Tax=Sinorhizobium fredii (strain NBRC 101917 / NGR234) TaxID=394 RepID=C3KRT3_SINFN|nr:hypothetical protein NGR_b13400 [Sinorhizobium fredii NGR234]
MSDARVAPTAPGADLHSLHGWSPSEPAGAIGSINRDRAFYVSIGCEADGLVDAEGKGLRSSTAQFERTFAWLGRC